jgi:hypothetical protein
MNEIKERTNVVLVGKKETYCQRGKETEMRTLTVSILSSV